MLAVREKSRERKKHLTAEFRGVQRKVTQRENRDIYHRGHGGHRGIHFYHEEHEGNEDNT